MSAALHQDGAGLCDGQQHVDAGPAAGRVLRHVRLAQRQYGQGWPHGSRGHGRGDGAGEARRSFLFFCCDGLQSIRP